jgi:L-fuculose-phosphate aldolase
MIDMSSEPWQRMAIFGEKIVRAGLATSRFGNMSILSGNLIFITKTGSMLDELDESRIIDVDLFGPCIHDTLASTETCVHRSIYLKSNANAIIHTHPPFSVAMSLLEDKCLIPKDSEGSHFLKKIPIIDGKFGTDQLAENASSSLQNYRSCIARGHGVFAIGENLEEAYSITCMVEHSAQILYLLKSFDGLQ